MSATKRPQFFVAKAQKEHTLYYWQPSKALVQAGFKTVPLGKVLATALSDAEELNRKAAKWRGGLPVRAVNRHGTLPWIIETFKQSPRWQKLRSGSAREYECCFRQILKWSAKRGDPPMRTITRRDAEQLWASLHEGAPYMARYVIARCSQLWNYAFDLDEDVVSRNPFHRLGLPALPSRSQVWQSKQIEAVCLASVAIGHPSLALAIIIAINTAQRPSDIRALRWSQYDGRAIKLTQIKTGARVIIPCTAALRAALDDARRMRTGGKVVALDPDGPIVAGERGQVWSVFYFIHQFRLACRTAGVPDEMQFRDLRRTATTALAEAGCTLHEIAAIGGWSVQTVAAMMAVYGKVNITMAESAITKLEEYRKKPLEG